jgi:hypothetical protein
MTSGSMAKYGYLFEDPVVRRWYQNVARGSRITADIYLRPIGCFCIDFGLTPGRLVEPAPITAFDNL